MKKALLAVCSVITAPYRAGFDWANKRPGIMAVRDHFEAVKPVVRVDDENQKAIVDLELTKFPGNFLRGEDGVVFCEVSADGDLNHATAVANGVAMGYNLATSKLRNVTIAEIGALNRTMRKLAADEKAEQKAKEIREAAETAAVASSVATAMPA